MRRMSRNSGSVRIWKDKFPISRYYPAIRLQVTVKKKKRKITTQWRRPSVKTVIYRDSNRVPSNVWMVGVLEFDSRRRLGIFLFTIVSRTALGPTQPPIQWIPGALSLGVKRPGREADHSSPSSAEVNNAWSYTSTLQYVFMARCLVKHRDNFTLPLPSNVSLQGYK
jgi:hypothetical protein